eukprot:m.48693 g.48693  ORF g.48693 m.48693 type:complete len:304 (+) comp10578_c0_seq1:80-991(+)
MQINNLRLSYVFLAFFCFFSNFFQLQGNIVNVKQCYKNGTGPDVILLGNQKCGTSIITALVASVSGKRAQIDFFATPQKIFLIRDILEGKIPWEDFFQLKRSCSDMKADIVKEADISPIFETLRNEFPKTNFGFVIRNPFDNIRSIYDRLKLSGKRTDYRWIKKEPVWRWICNCSMLHCDLDPGIKQNLIANLAWRWNYMVDIYLRHKNEFKAVIKYEDFSENKYHSIRDFAEQLELTPKQSLDEFMRLQGRQAQPRGKHHTMDPLLFFSKESVSLILNMTRSRMLAIGYGDVERSVMLKLEK